MVTVTILGAGVTGLSIASQLPSTYQINILGQHLPGDPFDNDYTSQWAGACWVGVPMSSPRDQRLQLESFAVLWRLAKIHPESGLRRSKMTEIFEYGARDDIWYSSKIPGFRWLDTSELPATARFGMEYQTVCISPPVFLSWMRKRLEARGVQFHYSNVRSLAELRNFGHDVLINATGARTKDLKDVDEPNLVPYRLQSLVIKKDYDECYIYRGNRGYYFNMFGRPDGTTYIGGIKTLGVNDRTVYDQDRQTILTRGHEKLPSILPSPNPGDYEILYDIATTYEFRPQEKGGVRVEKEVIEGQKVVHAYGQEAGGYCYSFGVAKEASELVAEYIFEMPPNSRI
ncbi:unnamed protein product [Clonostachys rosea f. rosea IK726]|uniref:Uncharacterized protein n=1 Tax=Clonostachys rosea f. rosea IK726 TaxID=1349383 RepID=A0ACA9U7H9_BIOOC|nr:unnamed protein product [Clonostachys rosea f. rosea IK726]